MKNPDEALPGDRRPSTADERPPGAMMEQGKPSLDWKQQAERLLLKELRPPQ